MANINLKKAKKSIQIQDKSKKVVTKKGQKKVLIKSESRKVEVIKNRKKLSIQAVSNVIDFINAIINVGSGAGVFKEKIGATAFFRSITSTDNIEVIEGTDEIQINMDKEFTCTATEQVNDLVYISAANTVAQANATDISTAQVVGFIASKSNDTTCRIRTYGVLNGFTGLTFGRQYFLSTTSGSVSLSAPTASDTVLVRVGKAVDADTLFVNINNNYIIRS
jgi:hypothetical protein